MLVSLNKKHLLKTLVSETENILSNRETKAQNFLTQHNYKIFSQYQSVSINIQQNFMSNNIFEKKLNFHKHNMKEDA